MSLAHPQDRGPSSFNPSRFRAGRARLPAVLRTAPGLLLTLCGCAGFHPRPLTELTFMQRAQTHRDGNVTVTTAVLSDQESRAAFGVDLAGQGIQPVWLRIENRDDTPYWLFPVSIDPKYYSPLEVAWHAGSGLSRATQQKLQEYLCQQQIPPYIAAGGRSVGLRLRHHRRGDPANRR